MSEIWSESFPGSGLHIGMCGLVYFYTNFSISVSQGSVTKRIHQIKNFISSQWNFWTFWAHFGRFKPILNILHNPNNTILRVTKKVGSLETMSLFYIVPLYLVIQYYQIRQRPVFFLQKVVSSCRYLNGARFPKMSDTLRCFGS